MENQQLTRIEELMFVHRKLHKTIRRMKRCDCPKNHVFMIGELYTLMSDAEKQLFDFIPKDPHFFNQIK